MSACLYSFSPIYKSKLTESLDSRSESKNASVSLFFLIDA